MENNTKFDMRACLKDIEQSIGIIYDTLPEKRNFLGFQQDLKMKETVQGQIQVIGDAMDKLLQDNPEISLTDYRKIILHRRRLFLYESKENVSEKTMWLIVNRYLPILKFQIREYLK